MDIVNIVSISLIASILIVVGQELTRQKSKSKQ